MYSYGTSDEWPALLRSPLVVCLALSCLAQTAPAQATAELTQTCRKLSIDAGFSRVSWMLLSYVGLGAAVRMGRYQSSSLLLRGTHSRATHFHVYVHVDGCDMDGAGMNVAGFQEVY